MRDKAAKTTKEMIFHPVIVDGLTIALSADGKLPSRIKVLKWGDNPNVYGYTVRVGEQLVAALGASIYPFRRVALDFEHNTYPGAPAYKESKEPRSVAGFGAVEVVRGEGVFLSMDKWTPEGVSSAVNYCDVSAVPTMDKFGNVTAIRSVALCRNGAVPDMVFDDVALSVDAAFVDLVSTNKNKKENPMKELWRAWIAKLLNKPPEEVTDEDVDKAVELAEKSEPEVKKVEPVAPGASAGLSAADVGAVVLAAVKPLQETVVALSATVGALQGGSVAATKQGIVDEALRQGKHVALSAAAVEALSPEMLQEHVAALSVTIPVDQRTPEFVPEKGAVDGITDGQRAVALSCGMDPEEVFGTVKKD